MAYEQKSKLESLFSYSFAANHLFQISLVKQPVEQSYKKEHFCFLTVIPGVTQQGNRTFEFANRITLKVDGHQIDALAEAIKYYVDGKEQLIGPYSIYVDSSKSQYSQGVGGGKSFAIQRTMTKNKKNQDVPMITIFVKSGNNPTLAISIPPAGALAMANVLSFIAKKCLELEFLRGPSYAQTGSYENPSFNTPQPQATPQTTRQADVTNNFSNAFEGFVDPNNPF